MKTSNQKVEDLQCHWRRHNTALSVAIGVTEHDRKAKKNVEKVCSSPTTLRTTRQARGLRILSVVQSHESCVTCQTQRSNAGHAPSATKGATWDQEQTRGRTKRTTRLEYRSKSSDLHRSSKYRVLPLIVFRRLRVELSLANDGTRDRDTVLRIERNGALTERDSRVEFALKRRNRREPQHIEDLYSGRKGSVSTHYMGFGTQSSTPPAPFLAAAAYTKKSLPGSKIATVQNIGLPGRHL